MKKNKKFFQVISIFFILLFSSYFIFKIAFKPVAKVSITNSTSQIIKDLKLEYACGESFADISSVDTGKTQRYKSDTTKINFGDNRVELTYKDNTGELHNHVAIGYLERGYREQASILLESVNGNGKLDIVIDGHPSICIICEAE